MKSSKLIALLALWLLALPAPAQDLSIFAAFMPMLKSVFVRLCPDLPDFSADSKMLFISPNASARAQIVPVKLAMTGNLMREELDIMELSSAVSPQALAGMKLMHLDKFVFVMRLDEKRIYVLFPGVEAYTELPISEATLNQINAESRAVTLQRTDMGQEMVLGHPCTKTQLVATEPGKPSGNALLWCADDLQKFPMKMNLQEKGRTTEITFSNVQIGKPDASLFRVPTNYARFSNISEVFPFAREKLQKNAQSEPGR